MTFLSRTQVIAAFGAVLLAFYVLDLVRRRRLSEEYSLLWVIASVVIALLGFFVPKALNTPSDPAKEGAAARAIGMSAGGVLVLLSVGFALASGRGCCTSRPRPISRSRGDSGPLTGRR